MGLLLSLGVLLLALSGTHCSPGLWSRTQRHALDPDVFEQDFPGKVQCPFETYPNSEALAGDVFYRHNEASDCVSACYHQEEFYCAAALRRGDQCYLTGFRSRQDYWSTHYVRICNNTSNKACYKPIRGQSFVHSHDYPVPWFMSGGRTTLLYCMALCNERRDCVGFDITYQESVCHMSLLLPVDQLLRFDVHLRRC